MVETIAGDLISWSRAQFALTAIYHWLFVPLTLGLAVIIGIMETVYYRTGDEFWKRTTRFWMKLFGINFAIGVATGLILEFQFGTNWSNYAWFVGDIFGAPLAIEGILAFFMEATFIAVMFFGWDKVSRRFHLASTWLTGIGATLSAWWILVANAWMQYPVGMEFNPETVRNEMVDFWAVALSPVAVSKFFHTVLSSWIIGAALVVGISAWYLIKRREIRLATESMKIAAFVGLIGALAAAFTGDSSAYHVAKYQPMKLAAMEGLYDGTHGAGLTVAGDIKIPYMLSLLATRSVDGFVPGINDLLDGGYMTGENTIAISVEEKMERGRTAIAALSDFRAACSDGDSIAMNGLRTRINDNMQYFGYGYLSVPEDTVPCVPLLFHAFRVMVGLGIFFIFFFILLLFFGMKETLSGKRWLFCVALVVLPLAYVSSHAGWIVAELGRQPWTIQDMLPVNAAISAIESSSVRITFFIFLVIFTILLIAEAGIMLKAVKDGPSDKE